MKRFAVTLAVAAAAIATTPAAASAGTAHPLCHGKTPTSLPVGGLLIPFCE